MPETPADDHITEKRYEGLYAEYAFIGENEDYRYVDIKNCFLRNFGLTGACIYVYEPVPPDVVGIYLRLYDPKDSTPINIMCAVALVTPAGKGGGPNARNQYDVNLTFHNMNDANKRRLQGAIAYLESLMPKKKGGIDYR